VTTNGHTGESNKERYLQSLSAGMQAPFSLREYRERLDRIRAKMEVLGLDLLYLSAPESMCYVSGHQSQWYQGQAASDWHPGSGIAIRSDADHCIHFEGEDELVLAEMSASQFIRIRGHETEEQWADFILSELESQGWVPGTVGLEMWSSRPNRGYSELFQAALEAKGCRVVDATKVVRNIRNRKSPQELAYMRTAQQIADIGMQAAAEYVRPGITELEACAEIVYAMTKAGGENPGAPVLVASGPKCACVHAIPSRRVIMPGDIVNVDVNGVYNRYHAHMARSLSMGQPRPSVAAHVKKVAGAVAVVAEVIRPNLPINDLLSAVEAYYREVGIWDDQWWIGGFELGIAFPPDMVGEFYYEVGMDMGDALFEPGVVCNYEANFYLPEAAGVALQTNTMAFTEDTAEFLNRTPPDLIVVE
jgi:Xaa-Pro aminopeptidase